MGLAKCEIWRDCDADNSQRVQPFTWYVDSKRAGGAYIIEGAARALLQGFDDNVRARVTTWLVDQRLQGVDLPVVTESVMHHARAKRPLTVDERVERLLMCLGQHDGKLGEVVQVDRDLLLAWTESTELQEVVYLESYVVDSGCIERRGMGGGALLATITMEGHRRIAEQTVNADSSQAFVAMWFDETTSAAYEEAIEPAIRDAGYTPLRIDQKEHVNKIEDEIVAEIRRSRFVVADFTQGDDGARGGVYYEAGFAQGLGMPVVFTCRRDSLKKVHFDTNHYNHIDWSTPDELRERLRNRILAVIGEGPELNRAG